MTLYASRLDDEDRDTQDAFGSLARGCSGCRHPSCITSRLAPIELPFTGADSQRYLTTVGHRYRGYAVLGACVPTAIVLSIASPAATAVRGWHLTDFPDACGQIPLEVAATGADAAWMMAGGFANGGQCPADGMDVSDWNGTAWTLLPPTTALAGQTGFDGAIAASSASNVWVLPAIAVGSSTAAHASPENWNGSAWTDFSLPRPMDVQGATERRAAALERPEVERGEAADGRHRARKRGGCSGRRWRRVVDVDRRDD
jgi:hypothetical protein